jgi:hypothetical protein
LSAMKGERGARGETMGGRSRVSQLRGESEVSVSFSASESFFVANVPNLAGRGPADFGTEKLQLRIGGSSPPGRGFRAREPYALPV